MLETREELRSEKYTDGMIMVQTATTDLSTIGSYYSYWWENPQDTRTPVFARLNSEVLRLLRDIPGKHALDLGAGRGTISKMLRSLGFEVTAVEGNPEFSRLLRTTDPVLDVADSDIRLWTPRRTYDVATCIEVAQVLSHSELRDLLARIRPHVRRLVLNISNSLSFHGIWVRARRFQAPFIVNYRPRHLESILDDAGYRVLHRIGVGAVTPVTLWRDFRGVVVGRRSMRFFSKLEKHFPRGCHLYLVDAVPLERMEIMP